MDTSPCLTQLLLLSRRVNISASWERMLWQSSVSSTTSRNSLPRMRESSSPSISLLLTDTSSPVLSSTTGEVHQSNSSWWAVVRSVRTVTNLSPLSNKPRVILTLKLKKSATLLLLRSKKDFMSFHCSSMSKKVNSDATKLSTKTPWTWFTRNWSKSTRRCSLSVRTPSKRLMPNSSPRWIRTSRKPWKTQ